MSAQVDEFYRRALAAGGKDNGPPGLRPHYHATYYAGVYGIGMMTDSMFYTVRVLATNGGAVVGQASPVSALTLDDGIAPGGGEVIDFDVAGHHAASATVSQFGYTGGFGLTELSSSVYQYEPRLGRYGTALASDTTGGTDYHVIGSDGSLNRTMVIGHSNVANDEYINVYDNASAALVSSNHLDVATQPYLIGGRVDPRRHRAAILGWNPADFSDQILALDLRTGQLGAAIPADVGTTDGADFNTLDIEPLDWQSVSGRSQWTYGPSSAQVQQSSY